jgi:hypothetical protein
MGDAAPGRSSAHLLSHYRISHDPEGHVVLLMPWPGSSLLGCAVPAAIVSLVGGLLALVGQSPLAYGIPVIALTFAAIVLLVLTYQGTHAWVLSGGQIRRGWTFGNSYWARAKWSPVRSLVLKRVVWPSGRGSSDRLFVLNARGARTSLLTVFNWDGSESRLATGGRRTLARTGPLVPDARRPMATAADESLMASVSASVSEMADLLVSELGVPLAFECEKAPPRPLPRPRRPGLF